MKNKKRIYRGFSFPCEKNHLAFKEENEVISTGYRNNLHKLKDHLDNCCDCGKNCKPIRVRIVVESLSEYEVKNERRCLDRK